ncbi:hypothetical protein BRE01_62730 [Brevibacillus reuszeri]|uniref:Uncharacterized protein n=1 Tax=Brevibacillus reuszeri TaxID=54915 RepID=A0A0K9YXH8_9BACL|nr:hypothetical protein [Brevibacillus reuszeri]KNB72955.1 hypothetical protein ADS79_14125 [Brevibacillus reuszeri]GED72571.1 hypothetical protein BRE01_62730 [Brevibacillus reuszeri]
MIKFIKDIYSKFKEDDSVQKLNIISNIATLLGVSIVAIASNIALKELLEIPYSKIYEIAFFTAVGSILLACITIILWFSLFYLKRFMAKNVGGILGGTLHFCICLAAISFSIVLITMFADFVASVAR